MDGHILAARTSRYIYIDMKLYQRVTSYLFATCSAPDACLVLG